MPAGEWFQPICMDVEEMQTGNMEILKIEKPIDTRGEQCSVVGMLMTMNGGSPRL